jgi:hypothetical protein
MNKLQENQLSTIQVKPNPVMVARQTKSLREVLRRMKTATQAAAFDPIINRKLEQLTEH